MCIRDRHKTDGGKITDRTIHFIRSTYRNCVLIPGNGGLPATKKCNGCSDLIGNMILTNGHIIPVDPEVILVVSLILIQGIVIVNVFNIRD